jgi:tetratricopeptide (TPR) repeat protein
MALADVAGNTTTSTSTKALEHFNQALYDFMHFRGKLVENIDAAINADPNFALGYAYKGYVGVLGTEPKDAAVAKTVIENFLKSTNLSRSNERERLHLHAAKTLLDGDFHSSSQQLAEISRQYPRDILALSVGHQLDFFTGNATLLQHRIERALPAWTKEDKYYSNLLGMFSFGLEESGDYTRAEEVGLEAVERNPKDVWAIHAVTHTYEMQANFSEGMKYLDARKNDWAKGNFFLNHTWWHYALYTLEAGQYDRALQIHDSVLFTENQADLALQLLDATALCWRLYLEGHDVKERFAKHAELWKGKLEPAFYAFNDMHVAMAFVGAGLEHEAETLIASREKWLMTQPLETVSNAQMTRDIGLPICNAVLAFGRGNYQETVEYLYPIRHRLHEFGGSHAQRDVVLMTLVEAALRGNDKRAKEILNERFEVKARSPYNWLKQATFLEQLGERLESATAKETARHYRTLAF